jgi:hypothetical protein
MNKEIDLVLKTLILHRGIYFKMIRICSNLCVTAGIPVP